MLSARGIMLPLQASVAAFSFMLLLDLAQPAQERQWMAISVMTMFPNETLGQRHAGEFARHGRDRFEHADRLASPASHQSRESEGSAYVQHHLY